ncbi:MAG: hypothetical protein LBQ23_02305 [Puniceicoccales bacterium]|jgi:hypothetical protein|nr:hypothetical protein [Puniceicoccales bacterium]
MEIADILQKTDNATENMPKVEQPQERNRLQAFVKYLVPKIVNRLQQTNAVPETSLQARQVQVEVETTPPVPKYLNGITLSTILSDTGRHQKHISGDGHNNCGFNSILEQVGDHTHTTEMINLLRSKLDYGNENSNEMLDSNSCPSVATLLGRPVIEICHTNNKLDQLIFSVPGVDLSFHFEKESDLSQNFVQWCRDSEWQQDRIDDLSRWLETNLPGPLNFNEATIHDIALKLLNYPKTIALVSVSSGGHFDAAPHKNLQREDSVLQLLRKTPNEEVK